MYYQPIMVWLDGQSYLHDSGIYIDAAADSQSAEDIKNDSSDES